MRPVYLTVVGSTGGPNSDGNSSPIPMDFKEAPFNVAIATILVTGSATWSVQYTYDDITAGAPSTWFTLSGISGATASIDSNLQFPVTAVRLHVTAGSGTVQIVVIQGIAGS